ncbi:MAG TPA: GFA family protein [Geminicoccus sp.]|jgi:hypothetical protein|uniref:GFA family protein n=1 Tax=Geminicoccus sp. TaxID=2024832 RepID=UPI002E320BF5|nr:GFA family protein [Geminicoccus sp.]HEX2525232.1 GFA family protein [Geminicoccus sp.]
MTEIAGGCHCGAVRFEAEADLDSTITCNCSYCTKRGSILTAIPAEKFRLTAGTDRLTSYRFNRHQIDHRFCAACGVQAFALMTLGDQPMAAINVRCVDDIDVAALDPQPYDGRSA